MDELNEAQKKALPAMQKRAHRENFKISILSFFRTAAGCACVIFINETIVHNTLFVMGMAFVTGIMSSNIATAQRRDAAARYGEELKNIK